MKESMRFHKKQDAEIFFELMQEVGNNPEMLIGYNFEEECKIYIVQFEE